MGERKVQNFYISPDFDPQLLSYEPNMPFKKVEVRMMMPFSVRCQTCGEYMYQGTKFTTKKEKVRGEDYHGIEVWRFFLRCFGCSATITIKTDPKGMDYVVESGATRNFSIWKEGVAKTEEMEAARKIEKSDQSDAMNKLEERTLSSKMEMDILDGLEEIKSLNQRNEQVDIVRVLELRQERLEREEEEKMKNVNETKTEQLLKQKEDQEKEDERISSTIRFSSQYLPPQDDENEFDNDKIGGGGVGNKSSEDEEEEKDQNQPTTPFNLSHIKPKKKKKNKKKSKSENKRKRGQ